MAYTDDAVRAKLSSLQESQESIVTVSQWIMFHRRYADRTAQLWMDRLRDSSVSKRLNLVYLVNEVVQQSKARKKDDFVRAFTPIIVDAMAVAYRGATSDVQQKLSRVVAVWRDRQVFPPQAQAQVEQLIQEADKLREPTKKARLGGSLLSSDPSSHPDLQPISQNYSALAKVEPVAGSSSSAATEEFTRLTAPDAPSLSAPTRAGKLTALLKSLANAESSLGDAIKARQTLVTSLEKLLETQRSKLGADETTLETIKDNRTTIETQKRDVEAEIMRSLQDESGDVRAPEMEPLRPEEEPLTPPAVESLTPIGSPTSPFGIDEGPLPNPSGADNMEETQPTYEDNMPVPSADEIPTTAIADLTAPANTILDPNQSITDMTDLTTYHGTPTNGLTRQASGSQDPRLAKRARTTSDQEANGNEFAGFADGTAMSQMDDDINAMLNG